jgi:hypothetical protein
MAIAVNDSFYIGAYWPTRPEPLEMCTSRAERFISELADVDALLAPWFLKGARRSPASAALVTDRESLSLALASGSNRRDADGSVIDELGFSLSVWNGDEADPVSLSIRCGISAPGMSNSVVVNLPPPSERSAKLYDRATASAVLMILVEAWDPDWATMTSNSLREAQGAGAGRPVLGWLTYLSANRGRPPALSAPFSVEPVEKGAIVVADRIEDADARLLATLTEALGPDLL